MSEHLKDPDLDRLVRELNAGASAKGEVEGAEPAAEPATAELERAESRRVGPSLRTAAQRRVDPGSELGALLADMVERGASDLHLIAGRPRVVRVDGRLARVGAEPLSSARIDELFMPHLGAREREALERARAADLSLGLPSAAGEHRFRVNLHRQRGESAAAVRGLPERIPRLEELNLPPQLAELIRPEQGLVLFCGPTGSGKSTTLAALIGVLNRTKPVHVVTIEEPIEYEHRDEQAVIEQIEVGADAPSFAAALRAALRQDPDVILLGELRDLETISTALTAAETGHLILSTLHTSDVGQAVHRIVDAFPADRQPQIRQQLALSLHAIVIQRLIPRADRRGRVPAIELVHATYPVRHHIRSDRVDKLYNEIVLGRRQGMIPMEESLARLVRSGVVEREEALVRSTRPGELESLLGEGG
ncbi:MAG TPA: PilT/PilU family type 4a pilus ATPase [Thermoanaerobaculia bacterium]|nr:PilT/PilU family type 4a pilus ATPase [Thermoanaerobaculia bacterium]